MYSPVFQITPATAKALMEIEAARQAIIELPIYMEMLASQRETARLVAPHCSTQIEGKRLTQAQVQEVVMSGAVFPGRERDTTEVRNYYRVLEEVERQAQGAGPISKGDVQRIHGLVMDGRPTATPYRDGQNVIRDSISGGIVYMPHAAGGQRCPRAPAVTYGFLLPSTINGGQHAIMARMRQGGREAAVDYA